MHFGVLVWCLDESSCQSRRKHSIWCYSYHYEVLKVVWLVHIRHMLIRSGGLLLVMSNHELVDVVHVADLERKVCSHSEVFTANSCRVRGTVCGTIRAYR